jgi:pimeloyl-ACP methyl ester carboxylesterase
MDGIYWTKAARERVSARYRALLASSPVPLQEVRIPTQMGDTCVFVCGSMQSPPLVLLHGGNANSAMWLRNLPAWSEQFRIYAIDTLGDPGFSATTRPPFQSDEHARWIGDVFKSLRLETASIVGASLGAWIGLDFAIRRPRAVSSLVLLAPAGIVRLSFAATLEISALMLMGAWGRRRALLRGFGVVNANLTTDQQAFLDFLGVVQLNALGRIRLPAPLSDRQLRKLSVRTLVVLGGRDMFFNSGAARRRLLGKLCTGGRAIRI